MESEKFLLGVGMISKKVVYRIKYNIFTISIILFDIKQNI